MTTPSNVLDSNQANDTIVSRVTKQNAKLNEKAAKQSAKIAKSQGTGPIKSRRK